MSKLKAGIIAAASAVVIAGGITAGVAFADQPDPQPTPTQEAVVTDQPTDTTSATPLTPQEASSAYPIDPNTGEADIPRPQFTDAVPENQISGN